MNAYEKQFYNVALNQEQAKQLNLYLKQNGIYFEPSACYNLVHFEIKMNEAEFKKVNKFIEKL